jgi:hypothetical protein
MTYDLSWFQLPISTLQAWTLFSPYLQRPTTACLRILDERDRSQIN